jgi:hypothetical protein
MGLKDRVKKGVSNVQFWHMELWILVPLDENWEPRNFHQKMKPHWKQKLKPNSIECKLLQQQ